jgi:transcription elongation factor GreB
VSRAFTKEPDGDQAGDELPCRQKSPHANYATPRGLELLKARAAKLREEHDRLAKDPSGPGAAVRLKAVARDLAWFLDRVESAIVVDPAAQPRDKVLFGARVTTVDENGATRTFTIVGEDEADAAAGTVSWVSPLATAVIGHRAGDVVIWKRPAGELDLEITAIDYPSQSAL